MISWRLGLASGRKRTKRTRQGARVLVAGSRVITRRKQRRRARGRGSARARGRPGAPPEQRAARGANTTIVANEAQQQSARARPATKPAVARVEPCRRARRVATGAASVTKREEEKFPFQRPAEKPFDLGACQVFARTAPPLHSGLRTDLFGRCQRWRRLAPAYDAPAGCQGEFPQQAAGARII